MPDGMTPEDPKFNDVQHGDVLSPGVGPENATKMARRHQRERKSSNRTTGQNIDSAMGKLAEAITGEGKLDLPNERESQREYVRGILDGIENSNRDCADPANVHIVRKIEVSIQDMDPEIADEVKVRLSLHDSSELIKQAGGWIKRDDNGPTIGTFATEALRRGHDITSRVIEVCYREGLKGINIPKAWDLLQDANFKYPDLITEVNQRYLYSLNLDPFSIEQAVSILESPSSVVPKKGVQYDTTRLTTDQLHDLQSLGITQNILNNIYSIAGTENSDADEKLGTVPTNYYTDSNVKRKLEAQHLLILKLGGNTRNAKKALQLAEKMAIATLETSVWNQSALVGNDELAECIGLRDWRKRRRGQGRPAGPLISEDMVDISGALVDGFGTSWNRLLRPGDKDPGGKVKDNTDIPQYSRDVDVSKAKAGAWQGYCIANVGRYNALKGLLLDMKPEPNKLDINFLRSAVPYFNTADDPDLKKGDKTGEKCLRVWWLAGVVDLAVSQISLGWDSNAINNLYTAAVLDNLSDQLANEQGEIIYGGGSFITPKQWQWIMDATGAPNRLSKLHGQNTIKSAFSSFLGPKKR